MAETMTQKQARVRRLMDTPLLSISHPFVVRAVMERGLTDDDIVWNAKLGRPPYWKETVDEVAEQARRAEWTRRNPVPVAVV